MENLIRNKRFILFTSLTIFLFCAGNGVRLAQKKMLWYDEMLSQEGSVQQCSVLEIIKGDCISRKETNNAPLFYMIQNGICHLFDYRLPSLLSLEQQIGDPKGQFVLRINPIFSVSLALTLIYYYFASNYSIWWGIYAVVLAFSSNMFWGHWVEARPYALWFFLTTIQSILFLDLAKNDRIKKSSWLLLIITHILLSLTVIVSASQILVVSLLLWFFKERNPRRYVFLAILPLSICFYYLIYTIYRPVSFPEGPLRLIWPNFPPEQLIVVLLSAVFLYINYRSRLKGISPTSSPVKGAMEYFCFVLLALSASLFFILFFKINSLAKSSAAIYPRYFIFLNPIAIIGTSLFSINLLQMCRYKKMLKLGVIFILIFLLSKQFLALHAKHIFS